MTGDTIARSRRLDGWQIVRIGLVVLWILWAALAWWTSPRHADTERMRADFDTGRVVAFEFADSLDGRGPWGVSLTFRFAPQSNEILVWRTPTGGCISRRSTCRSTRSTRPGRRSRRPTG
jgi:hypothetical protein